MNDDSIYPFEIINGQTKKEYKLKIFVLDFSKLTYQTESRPTKISITPTGSVSVYSSLKKQINELFLKVKTIKNSYLSHDVRIRTHFLVYPDNPANKILSIVFSIIAPISYPMDILSTEFRKYCTFYLKTSVIQKVVRFVSLQDLKITIDPKDFIKFLPPNSSRRINVFELISIMENLPVDAPKRTLVPQQMDSSILIGKNLAGKAIFVPKAQRLEIVGNPYETLSSLLLTPLIPYNEMIITNKPFVFRKFMKSHPEIARKRNMRILSAKSIGFNLLKLMKADASFAHLIFKAWSFLVGYSSNLLSASYQIIEWIQEGLVNHPDIKSFSDLLTNPHVLNSISIQETDLELFLMSFEKFLALPMFSLPDNPEFTKGGLIVIDCSSIASPLQRIAVGLVLHILRIKGYHNYSLAIPDWQKISSMKSRMRFQAFFHILQFNNFKTQFLSEQIVKELFNLSDLIIEPLSIWRKFGFDFGMAFPKLTEDKLVCYVHGQLLEIIDSFSDQDLPALKHNVAYWLETKDEGDSILDMGEEAEENLALEYETLDEFIDEWNKWVLLSHFSIGSPLDIQSIVTLDLSLYGLNERKIETILDELVETNLLLEDDAGYYSITQTAYDKIQKRLTSVSGLTPAVEEFIIKNSKNVFVLMNFFKSYLLKISSPLELFKFVEDLYLSFKSIPQLNDFARYWMAVLLTLPKNTSMAIEKYPALQSWILSSLEDMTITIEDNALEDARSLSASYDENSTENISPMILDDGDTEFPVLLTESKLQEFTTDHSATDIQQQDPTFLSNQSVEETQFKSPLENPPEKSPLDMPEKNSVPSSEQNTDETNKQKIDDIEEINIPYAFPPVDLHLDEKKSLKKETLELPFSELLNKSIRIDVSTTRKEENPINKTPNENTNTFHEKEIQNVSSKSIIPDSSSIRKAIPKPPSSKKSSSKKVPSKSSSSIRKNAILLKNKPPLSHTTSSRINHSIDYEDYDALNLTISDQYVDLVDMIFNTRKDQPPERIIVQVLNDCLIFPITEKNYYRSLNNVIDLLADVSSACHISVQEFTNELNQNLQYWHKFDSPQQRMEIINQLKEKFKHALKSFRYSHRFRETLRERIIHL